MGLELAVAMEEEECEWEENRNMLWGANGGRAKDWQWCEWGWRSCWKLHSN